MKYITVKLTEDQALATIQALGWAQNWDNDYPDQDSVNKFLQRIMDKLNKQLES